MSKLWNTLKALHRDEQGADMVEYILIIAAFALPMVGVLYWFRNDISQWAKAAWESIKGGQTGATDPDTLK
jgi:Flp pilus assembly pilin Flp